MTDKIRTSLARKPWQAQISRRGFLGGGIALAAATALGGRLPENLTRQLSKPAAASGSFDLSQVKHLVFLMQENRSFDHYFGLYPGVRGFSDPTAMTLSTGRSIFQQPDPVNPDGYLEPFHISCRTTGAAAIPDLSHGWATQHATWNHGAMDASLRSHMASDTPENGPYTMGYYEEEDVPFHWALAKAFTLCDNYHCAVLGPTTPNRLFWQNGSNDPQGLGGGPVLETGTPPPLTYESGAETLFNAGITFKWYIGGAGDWSEFGRLQNRTSLPIVLDNSVWNGAFLYGDGKPGGIGNPARPTLAADVDHAFEQDCANGVLPDVTFLGTLASEHPSGLPAAGAQYLAGILNALAGNDDLWNSTVMVLQYDENDGFFDHVPPPIPNKAEFPEEYVTKVSALGTPGDDLPVGGGFRVPCFVISPWSVGGKVFSGVSDHTSCLRLIESVAAAGGLSGRSEIQFPNISRWRRQTFGDLTGALGGKAKAAPSSNEFTPSVRAADLAVQETASMLPQPKIPGKNQSMPKQLKHL